jgi:ATP synthase protein I
MIQLGVFMKKNTEWNTLAKGIAAISQLGFSVITPIILCALLGVFLKTKLQTPDFILVILILLGIGSGISSAAIYLKRYLSHIKRQENQTQKPRILPKDGD